MTYSSIKILMLIFVYVHLHMCVMIYLDLRLILVAKFGPLKQKILAPPLDDKTEVQEN